MKRLTLLLTVTASALLAAGTIAVGSAAAATSTLPTLSLTITNSSITVMGAAQSGAVNVVSTATGVKEAGAILFLLKPGATFEEVETAIQKAHGEINVTSKYGSLVFDPEVTPGHSSEAQTYPATRSVRCRGPRRRRQGVQGARAVYGDRRRVPCRAAGSRSHDPLDRVRLPRAEQAARRRAGAL